MTAPPATVWVVTGANRGIGLELTRRLLERGDTVVAGCRAPGRAEALNAFAAAHPGRCTVAALDVTSDASVAAFAASLEGRPIDVLVNNAGVSGGAQSIDEMDYAGWEQALAVNTLGPFRATVALLPSLRRAERPRVVTVSSLMGSLSGRSTGSYAYRSSKAAVNKVMQVLSVELAPSGVIVVPVHPGWVRTDMGGPHAPLSVEESVAGLIDVIDGLEPEHSGRFLDWRGKKLPW